MTCACTSPSTARHERVRRQPNDDPLMPKPRNNAVAFERLLSTTLNPQEVARRRAARRNEPVAKLNRWVEDDLRTMADLPEATRATIPWFDPEGGGGKARLLFLMQDPSRTAAGTGFISPDNDDPTAMNSTRACDAADLSPDLRVHWNIYPWWVNAPGKGGVLPDPTRPAQTHAKAMVLAAPLLETLLRDLLPEIEVVVLLGKHAQHGWDRFLGQGGRIPGRLRPPLRCPSCSSMAWNATDKATGLKNSELTIETLRQARRLIS